MFGSLRCRLRRRSGGGCRGSPPVVWVICCTPVRHICSLPCLGSVTLDEQLAQIGQRRPLEARNVLAAVPYSGTVTRPAPPSAAAFYRCTKPAFDSQRLLQFAIV